MPRATHDVILQRASLLLSLREIGLELDAESIAQGGSAAAVLPKEDEEAKPIEGPQVGSLSQPYHAPVFQNLNHLCL